MALLLVIMGIAWGFSALDYALIAVLALTGVLCGLYLANLHKMLKSFLQDDRHSVITLDVQGVELEKEGSQTVRLAWSNVGFVRLFSHAFCFFPADSSGFLISVDRRYEWELLEYLTANHPDLRIVR